MKSGLSTYVCYKHNVCEQEDTERPTVDIFTSTSQELKFGEASTRHLYLNNERGLPKFFIFDDLV